MGQPENYFQYSPLNTSPARGPCLRILPQVLAIRTEHSELHSEQLRANILQYGLSKLHTLQVREYFIIWHSGQAFKYKRYTAYAHFHGNGLYGKIPTKKEPVRMFRFTLRLSQNMTKCCNCIKLLSLRVRVNSLIIGPFISLSSHSKRTQTVFH